MNEILDEEYVIVWDAAESRANDLLRKLMSQQEYPRAYRRLNSARMHLIETHTRRVQWDGNSRFLTNGDVWVS